MRKTLVFILALGVGIQVGSAQRATGKLPMTRSEVYNKVLGSLVGSAIGDAMGAPTEMWTREAIKLDYGFVDKLDSMVREPSAEGTWAMNLPAGGTTDDTRWKKLMVAYLLSEANSGELSTQKFAQHLVDTYQNEIKRLKNTDSFTPEPYEAAMRRIAWLQEWALVAKPFTEKNYLAYNTALSKFYGGEMVCGGMLYAPIAGAFYPGNPLMAYQQVFNISIFDLGYARDISGLTAAMTAAAMPRDATPDDMVSVFRNVDPQGYFNSRLVGRVAFRLLRDARTIVRAANQVQGNDIDPTTLPKPRHRAMEPLFLARMQKAFTLLDAQKQDMPFHAGEIELEVLTAMLFCDFDFEKTIIFLVNYGRDNDTTSAVAGGILGAYCGYDKLPKSLVKTIMPVNKQLLDTDFEALANRLTDKIMARYN